MVGFVVGMQSPYFFVRFTKSFYTILMFLGLHLKGAYGGDYQGVLVGEIEECSTQSSCSLAFILEVGVYGGGYKGVFLGRLVGERRRGRGVFTPSSCSLTFFRELAEG